MHPNNKGVERVERLGNYTRDAALRIQIEMMGVEGCMVGDPCLSSLNGLGGTRRDQFTIATLRHRLAEEAAGTSWLLPSPSATGRWRELESTSDLLMKCAACRNKQYRI